MNRKQRQFPISVCLFLYFFITVSVCFAQTKPQVNLIFVAPPLVNGNNIVATRATIRSFDINFTRPINAVGTTSVTYSPLIEYQNPSQLSSALNSAKVVGANNVVVYTGHGSGYTPDAPYGSLVDVGNREVFYENVKNANINDVVDGSCYACRVPTGPEYPSLIISGGDNTNYAETDANFLGKAYAMGIKTDEDLKKFAESLNVTEFAWNRIRVNNQDPKSPFFAENNNPNKEKEDGCAVIRPGQSRSYGPMWGEPGVARYNDDLPLGNCAGCAKDIDKNGTKEKESKLNFMIKRDLDTNDSGKNYLKKSDREKLSPSANATGSMEEAARSVSKSIAFWIFPDEKQAWQYIKSYENRDEDYRPGYVVPKQATMAPEIYRMLTHVKDANGRFVFVKDNCEFERDSDKDIKDELLDEKYDGENLKDIEKLLNDKNNALRKKFNEIPARVIDGKVVNSGTPLGNIIPSFDGIIQSISKQISGLFSFF
jgi:hypothetical protein